MYCLRTLVALACVVCLASAAWADPITNARPIPITIVPNGETSLQAMLNSIVTGGAIDVTNQSNWGSFRPTADTRITYVGSQAGYSATNEFWVYQISDPSNAMKVFDGVPSGADGTVSNLFSGANLSNDFGFMIDVLSSYRLYSDDTLNPGGLGQALVYVGSGQQINIGDGYFDSTDMLIAFEDLRRNAGADDDFNDILVLFENVFPGTVPPTQTHMPEPGSIIVWSLLAGVGGLATWRRARRAKNAAAPIADSLSS